MKNVIAALIFIVLTSPAIASYASLGKVYELPKQNMGFAISRALQENNFKDAANAGDGQALYKLGLLSLQENKVNQAFSYFEKACENDIAKACNNAGFIKHHNLEKKKKPETELAEGYYTKARELGDNFAIYNLARFYYKQKKYMQSYLHYEIALSKTKNRATQQILNNNKVNVGRKMNKLEKEYIKKYYPSELKGYATAEIINNRNVSELFPMPPVDAKVVINEDIIKFSQKDDKNIVMMEWLPNKSDFISLPVSVEKGDITDEKAISSLTYRYGVPAEIYVSLVENVTTIPILASDTIFVSLYSGTKEKDRVWGISSVIPAQGVKIREDSKVIDGWEKIIIAPQMKKNIAITFVNKSTKEKLELILIVR